MMRLLLFALLVACHSQKKAVDWQKPVDIAQGGGTKGPWQQNESQFDFVDDPSVALAPDGRAAVVWVDHRDKDVHFQWVAANGERSAAVNVSHTPDVFSWMPRIVIADRDVFIAWQEIVFSGGAHGGDIFFARSNDGGATFESPVNITTSTAGEGKARIDAERWHNGSLDLARGDDGTLYLAWTDYDGRLVFTHGDGASFAEPQQVAGTYEQPARAPSLGIAGDGTVYLAWTYGENNAADIQIARATNPNAGGANAVGANTEGNAEVRRAEVRNAENPNTSNTASPGVAGTSSSNAASNTRSPNAPSPGTSNTASSGTSNPNTASPNTASSGTSNPNTASSNTASSGTSNPNTASSNTASSNTSNPNTASSNTASSNTSNPNTANQNTSSSNAVSPNTASSGTSNTASSGTSNTASSGTSNPNTASSNTASSGTSNPNTASSNTASSGTANPNTASSNTASSNTASSNTASSNTSNPNTASSGTSNPNTASSNTASSGTANPNTANQNTSSSNAVSPNTASSGTSNTASSGTSNTASSGTSNTAASNTAASNTAASNTAGSNTAASNTITFEAPVVVARTQTYSDAPKLVVVGNTIHLAYAETTGGPFDPARIMYSQSTDGAHTFTTPVELGEGAFPSLAVDGSNVVVVFDKRDKHSLAMASSTDGGAHFSKAANVEGSRDPNGGEIGSQQGRLMNRLELHNGTLAVVTSALAQGKGSRVWLIRGQLRASR